MICIVPVRWLWSIVFWCDCHDNVLISHATSRHHCSHGASVQWVLCGALSREWGYMEYCWKLSHVGVIMKLVTTGTADQNIIIFHVNYIPRNKHILYTLICFVALTYQFILAVFCRVTSLTLRQSYSIFWHPIRIFKCLMNCVPMDGNEWCYKTIANIQLHTISFYKHHPHINKLLYG